MKPQSLELAGRPLHPSTLMMGYGYDPALSEGALKPPIFLTSTYVFESAADGKRFFEGIIGLRPGGAEGLVYGRFNGPDQEILEDRLALWEGAEEALVFSTGMSAITTALLAYVRPGDIIVHSAPLYAATEKLIDAVIGKFSVGWMDFHASAGREKIEATLRAARAKGRVSVIYLESPANPTNELVDIEAVAAVRDEVFAGVDEKPVIMCDNTFLGPVFQAPTRHGADISLYSLTKYVGGHSDLVGGACIGGKAVLAPILALRNTIGTITDPHTSWMLLRSLETVQLRMERAEANARTLCEFLRDHPKIERVGYLGFLEPGSAQRGIYDRHCAGAGSTFSVIVKGGEAEAFRLLDNLTLVKLAVSLGGTESLASHPAAMTHLSVPAARKAELGISDNLVRVSIGVEHVDDLVADFRQALEAV
ncbi:cystathionine gamma-synthase family protein [Sphingosinicella soli]|nr:cystathionine gamma-synthase family protein [Sphingosinicella soli]